MEDVKNTLKPLEWATTVRVIDKTSTFPMLVKPNAATAEAYQISEDPVLLHHFWVTQRLVAQSLEDEGAYVVGPQMEIPSEYTGTFQYRHDQKGNDGVVQTFSSVREIASSMPEKVFVQERLVVYPAMGQDYITNGEKVKSVILHPREQLTTIEKKDVYTVLPVSRFLFGGRSKYKFVSVPCVVFLSESTKEILNLPVSTTGKFSTLSHIPAQGREFDFKNIINEIDLPINLTTCRNCPQNFLDEHFLRQGMRLRITSIEEHEVIIGVTTQQKFVEFASDGVEFLVPKYLNGVEDREQEIAYQTALQRFLMECQIKNSPVNLKDYRKSIRNHISRNLRPTAPKAISSVAANRSCKFTSTSVLAQNGVSAIALLSSSNSSQLPRRSSLPSDRAQRHAMPLPLPPSNSPGLTPPLPPRNSRSFKSSSPKRPKSARPVSCASHEFWSEMPTRPPPAPPDLSPQEKPTPPSFSSFTNPSAVSKDEQIWETVDEGFLGYMQRDKNSPKQMEKNFADTDEKPSSRKQESSQQAPVISLDDFERSPSPEFSIAGVPSYFSPDSKLSKDSEVPGIANPVDPEGTSQETNTTHASHYENVDLSRKDERETEEESQTVEKDEERVDPSSPDDDTTPPVERETSSSTSSKSDVEPDDSVGSEANKKSPVSSRSSSMLQRQNSGFRVSRYSIVSDDSNAINHQLSFTCNYVSSPKDWTPPIDLSEMSVNEVANSLRYIGMNEDTVEWFRAEKVDGHLLCSIEDEVLTEHFRLTPFQRKKLVMFLKGWRPKLE